MEIISTATRTVLSCCKINSTSLSGFIAGLLSKLSALVKPTPKQGGIHSNVKPTPKQGDIHSNVKPTPKQGDIRSNVRHFSLRCKNFVKKLSLPKVLLLGFIATGAVFAQQNVPLPFFNFDLRQAQNSDEVSLSLQVLLLLSVLALVPSILIMMTSFVRIVIILKFVQRSLSLQQEPPNQVIMGLALFITFFVMSPTIETIYEEGYKPYAAQEISTDDFFQISSGSLKSFMLKQTREKDIDLFLFLSKAPRPATPQDVSLVSLIPAFLISEITIAFQIGVYLFVPFIVIDMIVASILMSMGMILIPPIMISLPFKIILFVLVDGWHLITLQTIRSFNL